MELLVLIEKKKYKSFYVKRKNLKTKNNYLIQLKKRFS